MALVSPGVEITVIDESQYLPSSVGTIPFVVVATAQDKTINGLIAPGTTKANAGKAYGITSQRELASIFGTPTFKRTSADTPIHGDELNEYGLMAAYSALGLGNRSWVMRADIDLNDLTGTVVRPTGSPANGVQWLDTAASKFGIFEFDESIIAPDVPFVEKTPTVLSAVPTSSVGSKGDYAVVVAAGNNNYVYKKLSDNNWAQLGTATWANDIASVVTANSGAVAFASGAVPAATFTINGTTVTITGVTTMAGVATAISTAAITGITARVVNDRLEILVATTATGQQAVIVDGAGVSYGGATVTPLNILGITAGTYRRAAVTHGNYAAQPDWRRTAATPRPSGSVWMKTSATGGGANLVFKRYNSTTKSWATLATPIYADGFEALYSMDATNGGKSIAANSIFVKYNPANDGAVGFKFYYQRVAGITKIVGTTTTPTFTNGSTFTITASVPGSVTPVVSGTVTISGTTAASFVSAVTAAGVANVTAAVESSGAVSISHTAGGLIKLTYGTGATNPISAAGLTAATGSNDYIVALTSTTDDAGLSNFAEATYTFTSAEPYTNPADGKLWYYSDPTAVDIMIHDGTNGWRGYRNVASDARGYNLTNTDANGVIVAASQPTYQSDGTTLVASGDLWLDTSDLENYPRLYRYDSVTKEWSLIDNADRITQNGIIFADARWGTAITTDPITAALPSTVTLLSSNYTDPDVPDYRLYPRGTLLFNTRRSGYNVKKFVVNYFNATAFPAAGLASSYNAWVTQIGYNADSHPMMGHYSQRNEIIQAMRAAIDSNLDLREEGYNFNLLTAPGYPELVQKLVELNNDRANTGFIIGDTPMTMPATINSIVSYEADQTISNPYMALYYPSALTTDLSGNEIAVPASHMMLRTYMYNDNVAYPWFAPAGTRRGLIDNALAIGYIDANSGTFIRTGINNNLRDTLYENRMNPVTLINGVGIVAYGQKTRAPSISGSGTSLDRVNVARLVNYLRTVLRGVANQFLFEPNDKITRDQIKQLIESLLNDLIAKRGLYDYLVVCDESNNTSDRIARNELYVDIAIEPMKAVEFIYIPIRLKNPGTIDGSAAAATIGA
jgi:hypothetical protein